jgi:hypothetical protein
LDLQLVLVLGLHTHIEDMLADEQNSTSSPAGDEAGPAYTYRAYNSSIVDKSNT